MPNHVLAPERYPPLPDALLGRARVISSRVAALSLWPQNAVIVEVGVGLGDFSQQILHVCRPRRFIAIDSFTLHQLESLWGKPIRDHFGEKTHEKFYSQRFTSEIAAGTLTVMKGNSSGMISALQDQSVDLFYVDADHSYEGVRRDLEALRPKVKADGWIVMNDYTPAEIGLSNEPYGVIQATKEFMLTHGWEMVYFALAYVMYCDVGLRRGGGPWTMPNGENRASSECHRGHPAIRLLADHSPAALSGSAAEVRQGLNALSPPTPVAIPVRAGRGEDHADARLQGIRGAIRPKLSAPVRRPG
jgi:hypothetical protein